MFKLLNEQINFEPFNFGPYQLNELEKNDYETLIDLYKRINTFRTEIDKALKLDDVRKVSDNFNEYVKLEKCLQDIKPTSVLNRVYDNINSLCNVYSRYVNEYFVSDNPWSKQSYFRNTPKFRERVNNAEYQIMQSMHEFLHKIPNIIFDKNTFYIFDINIENGLVNFYDVNRIVRSEWNLTNGKVNGMSKTYYKSGKLEAEWNFKDGVLDGVSKMYYESGKLLAQFNHTNGKPDGIVRKYHENGEYALINTYKNGELVKKKAYDRNGKLEFEQDYFPTDV